jgi:ABC-type multidrug transport system fused ATPase/permease subunit
MARKDSTVILVAHRLSTVINADKIAVVDGGEFMRRFSPCPLLPQLKTAAAAATTATAAQ